MTASLLQHIDEEDLPTRFGGSLRWEYGMHPNMDDEMRRIVGQMGEEWVEGPLRFVHGGGAEEQDSVMMEGQKDGNPRHGIASIIQGSFSDQQRLRREQYRDAEIELSQSH